MDKSYIQILELAKSKRAENQKFFYRLKKHRPADLDLVCNQLHDKAFEHIDCLKCANCCKTTGPLLLDKDIDRLAKHFKIKPSEFTYKYLRIDEDGDYVFKVMPCPFIGNDNLCNVYKSRPNACAEYPHTQQRKILQKLKITFENTMICPAVAEVTEGLKRYYL